MEPNFDRNYNCTLCHEVTKNLQQFYNSHHSSHNLTREEEIGEKRKISNPTHDDLFYDRDTDFQRARQPR